ncbi:MAG: glycosyltransferase 87 family protein [Candidatus Gottesmanbacteria bacterium]|nr:glycosyltransferase 87 family protein [Candidatus Gottesmanbacteria bacterium]
MNKKLLFAYSLASIALFLFSYTQVDLSLTLSRVNIYQFLEKGFQYIGYFDRPISTTLYLILVVVFFLLYGFFLTAVRKKTVSVSMFWRTVGIMTAILIFSYPAFSYDFFNYMFTAKTVLLYHKNPYTVIPLQFTGVEPWLSFMHWTHLPSAYTPFWILLTLPAYLLGFGYFLVIMWNIKMLVAAAYIITIIYIGKILAKLEPERKLMGMAIFAFNPLVIFETLVSGHNDMVMMAIVMIAYYLYLQKKRWASFFALSLSVAAKLMTIFIIPVFFVGWQRKLALWAMIIGFLLVASQREILGWYVVWLVPFYALLPSLEWALTVGTGLSLGLLLTYAPFLYMGNYDPPVQTLKFWAIVIPVILSLIWIGVRNLICPAKKPQV